MKILLILLIFNYLMSIVLKRLLITISILVIENPKLYILQNLASMTLYKAIYEDRKVIDHLFIHHIPVYNIYHSINLIYKLVFYHNYLRHEN
jgi:hypothetical protein